MAYLYENREEFTNAVNLYFQSRMMLSRLLC